MTGALFYGEFYQPPLVEQSTLMKKLFSCYDCTNDGYVANDQQLSKTQRDQLCKLMSLSNDHFPQIALMASLGLALVAVASSLRLFGDNKANFSREHASGLSSGAYYTGRTLAHLIVSVFAVLFFLLPFYTILLPHASFFELFGVFLLIYLSASGVGFFCSILFTQSLGTIFSILAVSIVVVFFLLFFLFCVGFNVYALWRLSLSPWSGLSH
jgi:hypothetical protein